ncbi:MAG: asparagine synthase-related protein, partial [Gammaproteobacteria bacterium]|nr:asparagine synthase-related protein [Gammaproteobacteria bacterium]
MLKPAQTITKGRVCTRCVMDETDPQISFNENGVCNHCRAADPLLAALNVDETESWRRLRQMADALRRRARGSEYDCLIGLSGGVDSSYVAYLAGKLGLRPLTVHFDNG